MYASPLRLQDWAQSEIVFQALQQYRAFFLGSQESCTVLTTLSRVDIYLAFNMDVGTPMYSVTRPHLVVIFDGEHEMSSIVALL